MWTEEERLSPLTSPTASCDTRPESGPGPSPGSCLVVVLRPPEASADCSDPPSRNPCNGVRGRHAAFERWGVCSRAARICGLSAAVGLIRAWAWFEPERSAMPLAPSLVASDTGESCRTSPRQALRSRAGPCRRAARLVWIASVGPVVHNSLWAQATCPCSRYRLAIFTLEPRLASPRLKVGLTGHLTMHKA